MIPQTFEIPLLTSKVSMNQNASSEFKQALGNIPYMSRVIKSICGSTQHLLIDMPKNCVGLIDKNDLKLICIKDYFGTEGRFQGAVQVDRRLMNNQQVYLWFDSGEIILTDKDSDGKYSQTDFKGDIIVNAFPIQNQEVLVCTQSGFIHYLERPINFNQKVIQKVSLGGLKDIRIIQMTKRTVDVKSPFNFVICTDQGI